MASSPVPSTSTTSTGVPPQLTALYAQVEQWLTGPYTVPFSDRFHALLDTFYATESPISLSRAMGDLPEIVQVSEQRRGTPVMIWPWVNTSVEIGSDEHDSFFYFRRFSKEIRAMDYASVYIYGNGVRTCHSTGQQGNSYFICNNKQFHEDAPPGYFHKWFGDDRRGGFTVSRVHMDDPVTRRKLAHFSEEHSQGYRPVCLEVAVMCAVAIDRKELYQLVLSVLSSMSVVQAVHMARGGMSVGCIPNVVELGGNTPRRTIGRQIAILSAVYASLLFPPQSGLNDKPLPVGDITVWTGLPLVDEDVLSNNMYWIRHLGDDKNNVAQGGGHVVFGDGNSLYFRDRLRPLVWTGVILCSVGLSIISVVSQPVDWSEKVEKFLNLLFTATVATIIGVASIQAEKNWLYNLALGRRRISVAEDFDDGAFADVIAFLQSRASNGQYVSNEQSSWVSDYNHGTTQIGRPVQMNELSSLKLSVSRRFELCVGPTDGSAQRTLELSRNGVSAVSGPVAAPAEASNHTVIAVESRLLLG